MWTSTMGMNPNYLYAGPGTWTQVDSVRGEAANHNTNGTGIVKSLRLIELLIPVQLLKWGIL